MIKNEVELLIEVRGSVEKTNFSEFEDSLIKRIDSINKELTTDDDFGNAEIDVKTLKNLESKISDSEKDILSQLKEIDFVIDSLRNCGKFARERRLSLEKLIKNKKQEIKEDLVLQYFNRVDLLRKEQEKELPNGLNIDINFEDCIKGLKTISSMVKKLDEKEKEYLLSIREKCDDLKIKYKKINQQDNEFLFNDKEYLVGLDINQLEREILLRNDNYKKDQEIKKLKEEADRNDKIKDVFEGNKKETYRPHTSQDEFITSDEIEEVNEYFALKIFCSESSAKDICRIIKEDFLVDVSLRKIRQ